MVDRGSQVAPRALACLAAVDAEHFPPLVIAGGRFEDAPWARLGVHVIENAATARVDAAEIYTCHGGAASVGFPKLRDRLRDADGIPAVPGVVAAASLAKAVQAALPDVNVIPLRGAAPWDAAAAALGAAIAMVVEAGDAATAAARAGPATLVVEVGAHARLDTLEGTRSAARTGGRAEILLARPRALACS